MSRAGGGALVRTGPPCVKDAARPLRGRLRRSLTRGSLPVLGREDPGRAVPCPSGRPAASVGGCGLGFSSRVRVA